jgi:hypothetical protein
VSLHVYADVAQRSDEWNALRLGMVTASVVGQLLTPTLKTASNDTSRGVVAALTAERITGYAESSYVNDDMMRGILHEPLARERYADHNGVTVDEVGFCVRDDWGFKIGASPDGLIGDDGGLEVKAPRAKGHIRTIVSGQIPHAHFAQVQTCLLVTGRAWWDYLLFHAGQPMWIKRVLPDPAWHDAIVAAVAAFEEASAELASDYLTAVAGLPTTERVPDIDELVI